MSRLTAPPKLLIAKLLAVWRAEPLQVIGFIVSAIVFTAKLFGVILPATTVQAYVAPLVPYVFLLLARLVSGVYSPASVAKLTARPEPTTRDEFVKRLAAEAPHWVTTGPDGGVVTTHEFVLPKVKPTEDDGLDKPPTFPKKATKRTGSQDQGESAAARKGIK